MTESSREALRACRLSQAIWAGQAELETKERKRFDVDPDISFVLLPENAAAR